MAAVIGVNPVPSAAGAQTMRQADRGAEVVPNVKKIPKTDFKQTMLRRNLLSDPTDKDWDSTKQQTTKPNTWLPDWGA